MDAAYIGRFAPSPTGPLHAGSLVAALASWLDARAHGGRWLVRIEDVDAPRCVAGAADTILGQLTACGLVPDETPVWQSQRGSLYQRALDQLIAGGHAYPCTCSRKDIEQALAALGHPRARHAELVYPGTCRKGVAGALPDGSSGGASPRAWRLLTSSVIPAQAGTQCVRLPGALDSRLCGNDAGVPESEVPLHGRPTCWTDRRLGPQQQNVESEVGDFVLRRADGLWAYQLAVVVDDAAQGITHVVRGADLADNTARQILLQRALGLPTPAYLHTPLALGANGEKLSKQNGAQPLQSSRPLAVLQEAGVALGLRVEASSPAQWLAQAVPAWSRTIGA